MFSGPKLLLLGALLWLVWLAFRLINIRKRMRNADESEAGHQESREKRGDCFVELTECKGCGAYVAAAGCDNADCPLSS